MKRQPAFNGRPAHVEAAALQHPLQASACRRCGLAVSQLCRGHEKPVGAQDLSATSRRTPTDLWRTTHGARSVPGVQRKKRSTPTAEQCPTCEAINSNSPDGCPAGEGLVTPTAGQDRGRRATSNPPVRSALPAKDQRQTPLRQHSLVGDRGRANHPPVMPVQQGSRTQGFYGRKPWKKPNSAVIIDVPRPAKEGLRRPFPEPPPNRSQNLTANPPHSRPGYRHRSPKVRRRRSSRFLIALRVSKSAV